MDNRIGQAGMKIMIDMVAFQLQRAGGVTVVWNEILKRMNRDKVPVKYILQKKQCDNVFYNEVEKGIAEKCFEPKIKLKILRYLPILVKIKEKTIVHSTYYRVSLSRKAVNVVTVHDFTYEKYVKGIRKWVHSFQKNFAIRKADGIICVSENTKKDLLKYNPNVNEKKITVIYNGVSLDYRKLQEEKEIQVLGKYNKEKFLLYVGDRAPYKKFNFAVEVAGAYNCKLVIIGGPELNDNEKTLLSTNVAGNYLHLRGVPNEQLNEIYNKAFCLLYPSAYEGFGIPVLEAKKAGCPVLAYNGSSIPEVMGESGIMLDSYDKEQWVLELCKLEDSKYRKEIIDLGLDYAKQFSWEKTYKDTINFYNTLAN